MVPAILDAFHPPIQAAPHVWVVTDLLYLHAKEKRVVMTNGTTDLFLVSDVTQRSLIHPSFGMDFGCRLGFGALISPTWDLTIDWVHFTTDLEEQKMTNPSDISQGFFPVWSLSSDILPYDWITAAMMHWDIDLNLLDFDFGRPLKWKPFFLRPFVGLRAALINQHSQVQYGGGIFANGLDLPALDSTFGYDTIRMRNDYFGIGPQVGFEPQLNLGGGWRLYANAAAAATYSWYKIAQNEVYLKTTRFNYETSPQRIRWLFDGSAGFLWRTFIAAHRFALSLKLGVEYHLFLDQVMLKTDSFHLISNNKDLQLLGGAFSVRFDF